MALIPTAPGDSVVYFFDFKPTLRASAAGVLLSTLFYGVVLHQVLTYGLRERGKRHPVEIWLVVLCASLSTGVFVAQIVLLFELLIDECVIDPFDLARLKSPSYGSPSPLPRYFDSSFIALLCLNPAVTATVQAFFARRAYRLFERNKLIGYVATLAIAGSFGCGIAQAVKTGTSGFNEQTLPAELSSRSTTLAHYISAAIIDVALSVLISFKFAHSKKGFNARFDSILMRLLVLSLTTASLTSGVAVVAAICAAADEKSGPAYASLALILPRVYAVSMMASLNLRGRLAAGTTAEFGATPITNIPLSPVNAGTDFTTSAATADDFLVHFDRPSNEKAEINRV